MDVDAFSSGGTHRVYVHMLGNHKIEEASTSNPFGSDWTARSGQARFSE